MAKSLSPAKQLEQAARMAIVVLAVGTPERIALAKALNVVARPKAAKSGKIRPRLDMMCWAEAHLDGFGFCEHCDPVAFKAEYVLTSR
jgi:hypothetical protein